MVTQKQPMNLAAICRAEQCSMMVRRSLGYDQHDDHVWRWLNYHLKLYGEQHPLKVEKQA